LKSILPKCPQNNHPYSFRNNEKIKEDGVVFYIVYIIGYFFLEAIFLSSRYLCHSSDTWLHSEELMMIFIIESYFSRLMWSGSDERHISYQDIPELRELIERELLEDCSYMSFSRIIGYLIEGTISSIFSFFQFFFISKRYI
jgi:hypothetical protein